MSLRGGPVRSSSAASTLPGWRPEDFLRFETNFLEEGVVTGLAVSQYSGGANMSVDVSAGLCLINVTTTLLTPNATLNTWLYSDAVVNVSVPTADSTNPRKDRIVAKFDMTIDPNGTASNNVSIELVEGTPAGSPSAPAEPSNAITLAIIDVPASDTTISDGQITDSRTYVTLDTAVLLDITRQGLQNSVAAGTGTNTVTASYTPTVTALSDRMVLMVVPENDNSGATTFNPDGLGAKAIRKGGNDALVGGEMKAKVPAILMYHQSDDNWKLLNPQSSAAGTLTVEQKTSDYTLTSGDSSKLMGNSGASGAVILSLPANSAGLSYEFGVLASQILTIRPNDSSTQSIEDGATSYIGYWSKTTYSTARLVALSSSKWAVTGKNGTWAGMVRRGYWGGGYTGSNLNVIATLLYSTEARSNLTATLPSAKRQTSGVSGIIAGYMMGGFIAANTNEITKLKFTDETCANIAATLDTASLFTHEGVQSATKGYTTHNGSASTAIEDLTFGADTSVVIAASITGRSTSASTTYRNTAGYFAGGSSGGSQDDIYKLTFSNETVSTVSNLLPANVSEGMGNVYSATIGYFAGGAGIISTIYKLTFSGETTGTVSDTLDEARKTGAGITEYATKGYWIGGEEGGGATDEIAGFTFSGETCADITATLSAAAYLQGSGMMNIAF